MAIKFSDIMNEPTPNTMVVDALNLAFRWKHTTNYNNFKDEFVRTVQSLAKSYKAGKTIITADYGASTYRKNIFPDYKADRKERFKDQTEEEKEMFEAFFNEFSDTLQLLSEDYVVLRYSGVEADDLAAHIVLNRSKYELNTIWLISSDKDWDLLINEYTHRFSFRTRKETTLQNWNEHYEVPPEHYISYKCIMGDPGDNINGIPGIGEKRAAGLVNTYGSAFDIYDMLPIDSKYKYIQSLNENGEILLRNYQLMDLLTYCDEAIGEENLKDVRTKLGDVAW